MRLKSLARWAAGMSKRDHEHYAQGSVRDEVPFVHQNHINLCANASAEMLLRYHGRPSHLALKRHADRDDYRIRRNPRGVFSGGNVDTIVGVFRAAGLGAILLRPSGQWTAQNLRDTLDAVGPFACYMRSLGGHWVVVHDSDDEHVIFHDPWKGANKRKTLAHFNRDTDNDWDSFVCPGTVAPFISGVSARTAR